MSPTTTSAAAGSAELPGSIRGPATAMAPTSSPATADFVVLIALTVSQERAARGSRRTLTTGPGNRYRFVDRRARAVRFPCTAPEAPSPPLTLLGVSATGVSPEPRAGQRSPDDRRQGRGEPADRDPRQERATGGVRRPARAAPLKQVIGPSVLLLAGAIGSGEYVLWPYITSQVGLSLVWLVVIGVGTQYFLNMEIERYTLATGETAVTGFTRLWKPWGALFIVMAVVPWAWPGWATGGTTTLSFALGFSEDLIPYITIGVLLLIGAVLTVSPVVYQTVEKIQFFLVALIVLFIIYAAVALLGFDGYAALGQGFVEVGEIPDAIGSIGAATLLGAIAFAGAGGVDEPRPVQLGPRQGPRHGRPAAEGRLAVHRRGGRRPDDRLLLPPRRGEHASLERLVEGRRPRAVLTFLVIGGDRAARLHDADLRHRRHRRPRRELRLHQDPGRGAGRRARQPGWAPRSG